MPLQSTYKNMPLCDVLLSGPMYVTLARLHEVIQLVRSFSFIPIKRSYKLIIIRLLVVHAVK